MQPRKTKKGTECGRDCHPECGKKIAEGKDPPLNRHHRITRDIFHTLVQQHIPGTLFLILNPDQPDRILRHQRIKAEWKHQLSFRPVFP